MTHRLESDSVAMGALCLVAHRYVRPNLPHAWRFRNESGEKCGLAQLPQLAARSNEFRFERKAKFLKSFGVSLQTRV